MIIRVFNAIIKSGKKDGFSSFLIEEAIPLLKRQAGIIDITVGLPMDSSSDFMMTTVWKDMESLKSFAVENWNTAVIDGREET